MSLLRRFRSLYKVFLLVGSMLFSPLTTADSISLSPHSQSAAKGKITLVAVSYKGGASANGVDLRQHFDSSALDFQEIVSVLDRDLVGTQQPVPDSKDYDGDGRTDMYILVAWADIDNNDRSVSESESVHNYLICSA